MTIIKNKVIITSAKSNKELWHKPVCHFYFYDANSESSFFHFSLVISFFQIWQWAMDNQTQSTEQRSTIYSEVSDCELRKRAFDKQSPKKHAWTTFSSQIPNNGIYILYQRPCPCPYCRYVVDWISPSTSAFFFLSIASLVRFSSTTNAIHNVRRFGVWRFRDTTTTTINELKSHQHNDFRWFFVRYYWKIFD